MKVALVMFRHVSFRRVEWNVEMIREKMIIKRFLLLFFLLLAIVPTSKGQSLPDIFDNDFNASLERVEKSYPEKILYYKHPAFKNYQLREFYGNNYSTIDNIYGVWDNERLIKVVHGKSFWDREYTQLYKRGQDYSAVYYASLIENNILNIKAEKKLFIDEVKIQLGIIPRPESKIAMSGGYSPELMQFLISQCKNSLVELERMYVSKRISKKDYLEKKKSLKETLAEAQSPRLTSAEEERVRGFIEQLQNDYPLGGEEKLLRLDSLSFARIIYDSFEKNTPKVAFKLTFYSEPNYQVVYKITLIPQTEYSRLGELIKEEEKVEEIAEEKMKVDNIAPTAPQANQEMQSTQKNKKREEGLLLKALFKGAGLLLGI